MTAARLLEAAAPSRCSSRDAVHQKAVQAGLVHPLEGGEAHVSDGCAEGCVGGGKEAEEERGRDLGDNDAADESQSTKEEGSEQDGGDLGDLREGEGVADLGEGHVEVLREVDVGEGAEGASDESP